MKKIIVFMIVQVLAFSLVACGEAGADKSSESSDNKGTVTEVNGAFTFILPEGCVKDEESSDESHVTYDNHDYIMSVIDEYEKDPNTNTKIPTTMDIEFHYSDARNDDYYDWIMRNEKDEWTIVNLDGVKAYRNKGGYYLFTYDGVDYTLQGYIATDDGEQAPMDSIAETIKFIN